MNILKTMWEEYIPSTQKVPKVLTHQADFKKLPTEVFCMACIVLNTEPPPQRRHTMDVDERKYFVSILYLWKQNIHSLITVYACNRNQEYLS